MLNGFWGLFIRYTTVVPLGLMDMITSHGLCGEYRAYTILDSREHGHRLENVVCTVQPTGVTNKKMISDEGKA